MNGDIYPTRYIALLSPMVGGGVHLVIEVKIKSHYEGVLYKKLRISQGHYSRSFYNSRGHAYFVFSEKLCVSPGDYSEDLRREIPWVYLDMEAVYKLIGVADNGARISYEKTMKIPLEMPPEMGEDCYYDLFVDTP